MYTNLSWMVLWIFVEAGMFVLYQAAKHYPIHKTTDGNMNVFFSVISDFFHFPFAHMFLRWKIGTFSFLHHSYNHIVRWESTGNAWITTQLQQQRNRQNWNRRRRRWVQHEQLGAKQRAIEWWGNIGYRRQCWYAVDLSHNVICAQLQPQLRAGASTLHIVIQKRNPTLDLELSPYICMYTDNNTKYLKTYCRSFLFSVRSENVIFSRKYLFWMSLWSQSNVNLHHCTIFQCLCTNNSPSCGARWETKMAFIVAGSETRVFAFANAPLKKLQMSPQSPKARAEI